MQSRIPYFGKWATKDGETGGGVGTKKISNLTGEGSSDDTAPHPLVQGMIIRYSRFMAVFVCVAARARRENPFPAAPVEYTAFIIYLNNTL